MTTAASTGYLTTLAELFDTHEDGRPEIQRIEIPLIQRDYAQGRENPKTEQIRAAFLSVLHGALTGGEPVSLDFVYGRIEGGTLRPLDGQQRLTTLFLLHWYLAVRSGRLDTRDGWTRFSYDTRPAARMFIGRLLNDPPARGELPTEEWVRNQPWFLHVWRHSPSVEGMVVMIRAIHEVFADVDAVAAWELLMDRHTRRISFYLLGLEEMRSDELLYITMNSRGKPLTEFETFKARFEDVISWSTEASQTFRENVDSRWADVLWPYRGEDQNVDDEFMRYIEYIVELCEWMQGRVNVHGQLIDRSRRVFGKDAPSRESNLALLLHAFETWTDVDDVEGWFDERVYSSRTVLGDGTGRVRLFPGTTATDLLGACCRTYDSRPRTRLFTLAEGLLLYAVLVHRQHKSKEFVPRLRQLRNILANSGDEIRVTRMTELLHAVDALIVDGSVDLDGPGFSRNQLEDEVLKEPLRQAEETRHHVYALEDHDLLRGRLAVFEPDLAKFPDRAAAFLALFGDDEKWPAISAALLTCGEYHRRTWSRGKGFWFGSGMAGEERRTSWRRVLTQASREELTEARGTLSVLLDKYTDHGGDPEAFLEEIRRAWLTSQEESSTYSWRYYMVRYPSMRQTASGLFVTDHGEMGYQLCMMRKIQLNSNYRDPYLTTICRESEHATDFDQMFTGVETRARWLRLPASETGLRCVPEGFMLDPPTDGQQRLVFDEVLSGRTDLVTVPPPEDGVPERVLMQVRQRAVDDTPVDQEDRIRKGAVLLDTLLNAGL